MTTAIIVIAAVAVVGIVTGVIVRNRRKSNAHGAA